MLFIPRRGERRIVSVIILGNCLPQSDVLYASHVFQAVRRVQFWLDEKGGSAFLNALFHTLEEMKYRQGFQPPHASNESEPEVVGSCLEYRLPVWKLIASELETVYPHHFEKTEAKLAEWLQEVMKKAVLFEIASKAVEDFRKSMDASGIKISINGQPACAWLGIVMNHEESGQQERAVLVNLIPRLHDKLAALLEEKA